MGKDSPNMIALREFTNRLSPENKYREIVRMLKDLVDDSGPIIDATKTNKGKIECYENMCKTITNILKDVNINGRG